MNRAYLNVVYSPLCQFFCAPCGYTRDSSNYEEYTQKNPFLPVLNNQVDHPKLESNKQNFVKLNKLVLVVFLKDETIFPVCSSWFCNLKENGETIPMEETDEYINDLFGLKTLN